MRQRAERRQFTRTIEIVQEEIHARSKRIPQQNTNLQCKARRRRNTRRILEKIGGYQEKMQVQPKNTRSNYHLQNLQPQSTTKRDKIIKGPLELRTVLETIEVDNYNRKYGDKKQKNKTPRKVSSDSSSNGEQVAFTRPARKRRPFDTNKKKSSTRSCHFCGKPIRRRRKFVHHESHNVILARRPDTLPEPAKVES